MKNIFKYPLMIFILIFFLPFIVGEILLTSILKLLVWILLRDIVYDINFFMILVIHLFEKLE